MAAGAVCLGGSRKAKKPISTISHSSAAENWPTGAGLLFWATAITRIPWAFSLSAWASTWLRTSSVRGTTLPPRSAQAQQSSISSTAPFVTIWVLPAVSQTTTLIRRRSKSKGTSSTLL